MSDYDEDVELSVIASKWERVHDQFLTFEMIPEEDRPFSGPDLCAWALLDKRFPSPRNADMVSAAEHDEIWLRIEEQQIAQLTDGDILYLTRCGIRYDDDECCLCMFV